MTSPTTPAPHPLRRARRLAWVDGSALAGRDLRDAVAAEEAMLALHVRGLHDAWGVGLGLATLPGADGRSVMVTPGFAVTCLGASLLLPAAQLLPAPPADGGAERAWDVVLEAPAAADPCRRPTPCDADAPPRVARARWHPADVGRDAAGGVVLARYRRLPTGLLDGPDLAPRRGVRVLERPHVASGTVPAGAAAWTASDDRLLATLDTAAAGFTRPAIYRVTVAAHAPWPPGVVGALLSVVSAARGTVRVQLLVPGAATAAAARAVADGLALAWLGVEPVRGCPPAFTAAQLASSLAAPADLPSWSAALAAVPGFQP